MNFSGLACAKEYQAGDPAASDPAIRVDSWQITRSFRCAIEPITSEQIVRAGRDSAEKQYRIYYRPFALTLDNSNRVSIGGKDYDVIYANPPRSRLATTYVDVKAV